MSVTLTVSQVRAALLQADGQQGRDIESAASTAQLGTWFHEGLCWLMATGPASPLVVLGTVERNLDVWKRTLVAEIYTRFVGPKLTQNHAVLQGVAAEVLSFWLAMQAAGEWIAELSWRLALDRKIQPGAKSPWEDLASVFHTEESLVCELREPGWSDSVRLVGIADAVVRRREDGAWCVVEFKLGQTPPAVNIGQACLYHLILAQLAQTHPANAQANSGSLALITFRPERHEILYTAAELQPSLEQLKALIGKLAGVTGNSSPTPVRPTASNEHEELGRSIIRTLAEYGVRCELAEPIVVGPTFLRYVLRLGIGTKVSAVENRTEELQVRMGLSTEPFISRANGQLCVDIQRPDREKVDFQKIVHQIPEPAAGCGGSHVPIGVDLDGKLVCADLARPDYCHFLAAGTTGSGKSEWLRLAIAGLLVRNTPATLRLLIIDPKRNAFYDLRNSPYLWKPIVFPDDQSAGEVLESLVQEMERRYQLLEGADSIAHLAERTGLVLPRIVCVCDEFRDLLMRSKEERKQIEHQIGRLGAKSRAAGIHLILATQEPSRTTITGPLDTNIPARVGLKLSKGIESRMLLKESGAEKLLGHGDLLFRDVSTVRRLQAPLLHETDRLHLFGNVTLARSASEGRF